MTTNNQTLSQWKGILAKYPKVEFIWLKLLWYTSNTFVRMVPRAKFEAMIQSNTYFNVPLVAFYLTPGDHPAKGASPSGSFQLCPDLSTAYCQAGSGGTRLVIQCECTQTDGSPLDLCARSRLRTLDDTLQCKMGMDILIGFEIEVVFMKPEKSHDGAPTYSPLSSLHSWSSITRDDLMYLDLIERIARSLADVGIMLEHFHSEAAPGQWEFVLPPERPVQAIDSLLKARETIKSVACSGGLHATLYPRVIDDEIGTGAHVHISVNNRNGYTQRPECFFGGIIQHMPSILAFTLPQEVSYQRVQTGLFSGGEYACWGWENKEASLRRVDMNRFEFKLMDGLANPYLALSAILAAGLDGLEKEKPLLGGPCDQAYAHLQPEEQKALGITTMLPKTLKDSLAALEANPELRELLGPGMVSAYSMVKRGEADSLRAMPDDARKAWLISRY
ncbi:GlnA [Aspergillus parasiticus SU-1]|uniref:GlnA n=1 Tax=Aspergillus parasiticus (strain ATCC 56775 / NRRL 5862 / SRRC 143 / SU-1) TaxID=1403190 RepID=A0A0F0HZQ2_ASPPU|nr:GlnA [Aspergillus parasiticus SU-1]